MTNAVESEVLTHNLALIVQVLRDNNISSMTIEYSGSGDSGDTFDVTAFDAKGDVRELPDVPVMGKWLRRNYTGAPSYAVTLSAEDSTEPRSFSSFVEDFHCDVLTIQNHAGYENNDGGGGTLTLSVDGTCSLEHYDYYMEKEECTSDLSEFMPPMPTPSPEPQRENVELPKVVSDAPYCVEV